MRVALLSWLLASVLAAGAADEPRRLPLPARPVDSRCGTDIVRELESLDLQAREDRLFQEIAGGNAPEFLRTLHPVGLTNGDGGALTFWATPDYLAVGHDTNFLRVPLTPMTAQRLADLLDCSLPTPALVDALWRAADVQLEPQPMAPGPDMTRVPAFLEHHGRIQQQLGGRAGLIAGHKKDVVLGPALTNRVAIYGWHRTNGQPIQPLYTKHAATWVDYSHGIRLIANQAVLDGKPTRLADALTNVARYATNWPSPTGTRVATASPADRVPLFGERETEFSLEPGVRVRLNLPPPSNLATNELLVFFALPNGNTIEQSAGRRPAHTNEWRYDIQHIAAQMRFVRAALPQTRIGLAYLEAEGLSWPAWRRSHGNDRIPALVDAVRTRFSSNTCAFALTGHSGGGSLICGYVSAVTNLQAQLQRIAFLDANYAYDSTAHHDKLVRWLKSDDRPHLLVLAYHDSVALLNGETFVSAEGGTWGRSVTMLADFSRDFTFLNATNGPLRTHRTGDGRIEFRLRENPERRIWHTILVERNGFIHALLAGTSADGRGYGFLEGRAYGDWIAPAP